MKSAITSKFQTTIPKAIREELKLSIHDTLDWKLDNGRVIIKPIQNRFLEHRNSIRIGKGNIANDVTEAKKHRIEKYK
ncbi:MAG: AbrB/MazE/SpoVT family DNA-binding domain-containing protein [SAR324 cluster bacterium]|nr:AbrB/MazE/SpoVT family DNA-binding domain-containing protein [SAR324 cluster bacterium]